MSMPVTAARIVPMGAVLSDLRKKADECEEKAEQASEPEATKLREEAQQCRQWAASLRFGEWCS